MNFIKNILYFLYFLSVLFRPQINCRPIEGSNEFDDNNQEHGFNNFGMQLGDNILKPEPQYLVFNTSISVIEHSNVTLPCNRTVLPDDGNFVIWRPDSDLTILVSTKISSSIQYGTQYKLLPNNSLEISNIPISDSKRFICEIYPGYYLFNVDVNVTRTSQDQINIINDHEEKVNESSKVSSTGQKSGTTEKEGASTVAVTEENKTIHYAGNSQNILWFSIIAVVIALVLYFVIFLWKKRSANVNEMQNSNNPANKKDEIENRASLLEDCTATATEREKNDEEIPVVRNC